MITTDMTPDDAGEYRSFVEDLKRRVREARLRASVAVNQELVLLYWHIGKDILDRQKRLGWGAKVIDQLSADLRRAFPEMKGFSARNLLFMRRFAQEWGDEEVVKQLVSLLPWGHNIRLIQKLADPELRLWYLRKAVAHGWSRDILLLQIDSGLHAREGAASTNFSRTLPSPQSDLARQVVKDPYCFDFLTLADDAGERELERGLVEHIRDFLLELGKGFAFMGSQVHLEVGDEDFYLDMLFYHVVLRCYVVVELKSTAFKPEHAGKLNFYLSAVDDLLRHVGDQPTLGILLCKTKNNVVVEYALRDMNKPIGVANWETKLVESLPDELRSTLPSVEALEAELSAADTHEVRTETDEA
ncbi:MAG: DUF1016 domain-containing protein [Deltaproteobacteria bacterium]|nr:DUF1016 domain-containing protein [Deltaproteobacteria bacterium]